MSRTAAPFIQFLTGAGLTLMALLLLCYWYLAAAWLSASLPIGAAKRAETQGAPPTFLCEAPFHTDIALPLSDPLANWRADLAGPLPAWLPHDTYLLFGWGDSVFFTRVLEPDDMTISRALGALAGLNQAAMRIVPVDGHSVRDHCEMIPVDDQGRAALIAHIEDTLRSEPDGRLKIMETPVDGEILVRAKGRYSMFNTCNQWTAAALGKAGLPRAGFAPFSFGVTKPLERTAASRAEE